VPWKRNHPLLIGHNSLAPLVEKLNFIFMVKNHDFSGIEIPLAICFFSTTLIFFIVFCRILIAYTYVG
jgi:hypothetical protein